MRKGDEFLPKFLQPKSDEEKGEKKDQALAKASSPPKTAAELAAGTLTTTTESTSLSTRAMAIGVEKKKGRKQRKKKEKQANAEEEVTIESNGKSNSALVIDEHAQEAAKISAAPGQLR